eukprot:6198434-Pleurochrysis_carterae.AAC.2
MAEPNEAILLSLNPLHGGAAPFMPLRRIPLYKWDLHQYKNHTQDWQAAFVEAVRVRSARIKHKIFIGLSGGYDSGAIMLALRQLGTPFLAYSIRAKENMKVVHARAKACMPIATVELITLSQQDFDVEQQWLREFCEPYHYIVPANRRLKRASVDNNRLVADDPGAVGLSSVLRIARPKGGLIYLSGSGADEIISDYAMDGRRLMKHSCFKGVFPSNLSANGFFPWCSFYHGTQRAYLMKEEMTAGAHGVEGRYPFLDPQVVQEYLWLSAELKNSEYKRPVADFLRSVAPHFPNAWKEKQGFSAQHNFAITGKQATAS